MHLMTGPTGNRVLFPVGQSWSVCYTFQFKNRINLKCTSCLRVLVCLVLRTSSFLILYNPKVVFKFFSLFFGCFTRGLRAFLLNFLCYDLKVFLCRHYNEQVISLTDAQICRILNTFELKVRVVVFIGREKLHVTRIWVGRYNNELCIPVHYRISYP